MPYPISMEGEFPIDGGASEAAAAVSRIAAALESVHARSVVHDRTTVSFKGGLFRWVSNWNVLNLVGEGEVTVLPGSPARLSYSFSCVQPTLWMAALGVGVGVFASVTSRDITPLLFFTGAVVLSHALSFAMDGARLKSLLKKAAFGPQGRGKLACPECGTRYDSEEYRPGVDHFCASCGARLPI